MVLLWSGKAGAWSPPETIEGHLLATLDLARVHDGITAREELRAFCR
jgi:hypothetical protein